MDGVKTRVPESPPWTAGPRCAKGPGCSVGLEFCPGNEGSTVLEAQVRKRAVHPQPHSRRRGPDSRWGCSTILGATGTDEHAGGFARRAAKILPLPLPPDGCSGLRAYSWLKSVLAGAGDVWVTLPSNLATCWLGTLPFSSQGSRKPPPGLPSSSVCLSYLQMKGAEILWTGE